jgi:hypothetical protein
MLNVQISGLLTAERRIGRVRHLGVRFFWALFALEAALVLACAAVLVNVLPQRTSLSQAAKSEVLRAAVLSRLDGALEDPVIEVVPGVMARSSAVRGLELDGVTYHYYFENRQGFDPLSRGSVNRRDVEVLLRETNGERTLVIYRILAQS